MTFEWDEAKNRSNLRKHGFNFAEADELFRSVLVVEPDTREDYGEKRWIGLGMVRRARCARRSLRNAIRRPSGSSH